MVGVVAVQADICLKAALYCNMHRWHSSCVNNSHKGMPLPKT
jgi:urease accessory protein UreF